MKKTNRIFSIIFIMLFVSTIFCSTAFAKINDNIKISNVTVTDVSASGYTVTCDISSDKGIASVLFPTWTDANGQDDVVWNFGTVSGNKATFKVDTASHNSEAGSYTTHIYVRDSEGNMSNPVATNVNVPAAQVKTSLSASHKTASDDNYYTLSVKASKDIKTIGIATWTEANGQDDLTWAFLDATTNMNDITIYRNDHGNAGGTYINHIYGYDAEGNILALIGYNVELKSVANSYINITDVRTGDGFYDIDFEHSSDVTSINYATWTEANGQDDLLWLNCDANTNTIRIFALDHNNEIGIYFTHLYANTASGNVLPVVGKSVEMADSNPFLVINDIENSNTMYSIQVMARSNVARLAMATWTEANGQDDLIWQSINDISTIFYVNTSEHNNEGGTYINHIYAFDNEGNVLGIEGYNIYMEPAEIISYDHVNSYNFGYFLYVNARYDVAYIRVATWSEENGQDDVVWSDMRNDSYYNNWSVFIDTESDHSDTDGIYINHLYAYDSAYNFLGIIGINVNVGQRVPYIDGYVKDSNSNSFSIESSVSSGKGINKVMIATWSEKNGQDDLTWKQLDFNGTKKESIIYQVNLNQHNNETGLYHTHIYAYDMSGAYSIYGIDYNVPTRIN